MKPPPFDYVAPETLDEAVDLLAEHGDEAKPLAGGQSLVPLMAFRLARPALLIDLNTLPDCDGIHVTERGELAVGALERIRTIELSEEVGRVAPLLGEAVPHIGHPQIRNRGTIGGSIAHADPSAELPVVAVASRATMVAASSRGVREIPAADFFRAFFTTALAPDEILTAIRVPRHESGVAFLEVSRRRGDFALVAVAARVRLAAGGLCESADVALGGVADRPLDVSEHCRAVVGERITRELALDAGSEVVRVLAPAGDVHASGAYRRHVAGVLVQRALSLAYARALESGV